MIFWGTIAVVLIVSAMLIVVLKRKRHGREPLALIGTVMAVLALLLTVAVSVQSVFDQAEARQEAKHRDALMARLIGIVAQIQNDQANRNLSPAVRAQRLVQSYREYNVVRSQVASSLGEPAPTPIEMPAALKAAATAPAAAGIGSGAGDATNPAPSPRRNAADEEDDGAAATTGPPAVITSPPPPPPPPPPPM